MNSEYNYLKDFIERYKKLRDKIDDLIEEENEYMLNNMGFKTTSKKDVRLEKLMLDLKYNSESGIYDEIPYFNFPEGWKVKIMPSFEGSLIYFYVKSEDEVFFVFFSIFDRSDDEEQLYWRVFWYNQSDSKGNRSYEKKFNFDETDKLINQIQSWIDYKN